MRRYIGDAECIWWNPSIDIYNDLYEENNTPEWFFEDIGIILKIDRMEVTNEWDSVDVL